MKDANPQLKINGKEDIFSASTIGIYIIQEGKFVYVNKKFEELTGYTIEELKGRNSLFMVFPEEREPVRKCAIDMLKGKRSLPYEYRILNKNLEVRWIMETVTPIEYMGKRAVLGYFMDITDKKLAERALIESEKKFRNLVESASMGIFILKKENIVYSNQEATNITEFSPEELSSMKFFSLFPEEYKNSLKEKLSQVSSWRQEIKMVTKNGRKRWIDLSLNPFDEVHFLALIRDVTEEKMAKMAVEESERRFRSVVENFPDGIAIHKDFRVIYVNPSALKMWGGSSPEEIIGKNIFDFVHPDFHEMVKERISFMLKENTGVPFTEERFILKNGYPLDVEVTAMPVLFGGEKAILTIVRDITERKRIQRQLESSLEQVNRIIESTIQAMGKIVETKDPYTAGHHKRTTILAMAVARELGFHEDTIKGLKTASLVHDIGKIFVPSEILNKPGPINGIEFEMIKLHPQYGYEILKMIDFPWPVAEIVYQHHEMMNGSGYPRGLRGDKILPEARILAIADFVEALSSHRPYRPAKGVDYALNEIKQNRGTLFWEEAVDAVLKLFQEKGFKF